ncbi:MAG: right-handed parallel beta-helix repeat-containing protein [Planctomycetota bacterium]|jgi:predicted outer membrane repeat protein
MRCAIFICTIISTSLLVPATVHSKDIFVPKDHPTIQQAIDAAEFGDRVLVAPGTYVEHLDFKGKTITLSSEEGAESTVIDGNQTGRVVTFQSGETPATILEGFTITNGNVVTSNGGGIDCTLESSPTIRDCVIAYNRADALGGGIACRGLSNPSISRCTFIGNICRGYYEGSNGGGICCFVLSNATIEDCVFIGNESEYGGAIQCGISFPSITNCLFIDNVADKGGGAIDCAASDPFITNCTFVQNSAFFGGGLSTTGVYLPSYPVLTNCILWNNDPDEIKVLIGSASVTYSDVQGGWPGEGNIDSDPLFVDTPVDSGERDLHLFYGSPCRDAGTNTAPILPDKDFEGDPRIANNTVDMGADEFYTHLYYTGDAIPGGDIELKLVGQPGTSPVGLFYGFELLDSPLQTQWGTFYLEAPWFLVPLTPIPGDGVLFLSGTVPLSPPAPYDLPMQALIGLNPDSLTNLSVLEVR